MRVGVIRGDLPGPVFLGDLETVSQQQFPIEARGQTQYLARPDLTAVAATLTAAAASLESTSSISFPLVIGAGNKVLKVRHATSGSFTTVTLAQATYANITTLSAAVNAALATATLTTIVAEQGSTSLKLRLRVTTPVGTGAALSIGTTGSGSSFNGPANFTAGGMNFVVPTAAATITALLPVGGPLDVSRTTIKATVSAVLSTDQVAAVADAIAPKFVETNAAIKSFEVGQIATLLSSTFNPDSRRMPPISSGAAVTVVADDGTTLFAATAPTVSSAAIDTPNVGDITISGTYMANSERDDTTVKIVVPSTGRTVLLQQKTIRTTLSGGTQGVVSPTSIVIPASLITGYGIGVGSTVQVRYLSLASATHAVA